MLSVIVPTYNESESILNTITRIKKELSKNQIKYEIIVSDDDSPDKTWEIVERLSKEDSTIKIIRRLNNKGLSPAVIDAFKIAKGKYFLVLDADGQHDESKIPSMLKQIEKNDIVIASRYKKENGVKNWSFSRILMSRFASYLAYPLIKQKNITDPMSGFFMVRKGLFYEVQDCLRTKGFKILLDILFCSKKETKVSEVPYIFKKRKKGRSKFGVRVQSEYLSMISKRYINKYETLLKFIIVGAIGTIINLAAMYSLVEYFNLNYILASAIAVEVSIINNFILNNLWTFKGKKLMSSTVSRFLKFNTASILALTINVATLYLLVRLGIWYLIAQFIGIVLAFGINFIINIRWVFKK